MFGIKKRVKNQFNDAEKIEVIYEKAKEQPYEDSGDIRVDRYEKKGDKKVYTNSFLIHPLSTG